MTDAMAFPFPRAVHLRNRRDRESASSDSDDDSLTKDGSLNSDRNDCDSIASDDFDQDGYLPETATSLEEHRVAVARAGGNMDGIEEVKVSVPGSGGAAELECAELISRHVNEYIGGPQVSSLAHYIPCLVFTCLHRWRESAQSFAFCLPPRQRSQLRFQGSSPFLSLTPCIMSCVLHTFFTLTLCLC